MNIKKAFLLTLVFMFALSLEPRALSPVYAAAGSNWFNEDWHYRKSVVITNNGSAALVDFQVQVTADTSDSTKFKASGCADMRFTDVAGNTLNYWIESGANTATTRIWVKIPYIPTSTSTIYMYYGNPDASAVSNGDNVFIFFDDFENGAFSSSKWGRIQDGAGAVTIDNSIALGSYSAKVDMGTAVTGKRAVLYTTMLFSLPLIVEHTARRDHSPLGMNIGMEVGTSSAKVFSEIGQFGNHTAYPDNNKKFISCGGIGTVAGSDDTWYKFVATLQPNSQSTKAYTNYGASLLDTVNTSVSASQAGNLLLAWDVDFGYWDSADTYLQDRGILNIDNVFVRKYASTGPTAGAPGIEEVSLGPVACWKFDEAVSGSAHNQAIYDMTTNSRNGTGNYGANSTGMSWATGKFGGALNFDGVDDVVNVPSSSLLDTSSALTYEAWIKWSGTQTSWPGIVGANTHSYYGIRVNHNSPYNAYFEFGLSPWDGSSYSTVSAGSVNDGNWHHVAFTYDGTIIKSYKDGVYVSQGTPSSGLKTGAHAIAIGGGTAGGYWNGLIDDVRICNYACSAAEILIDYNEGASVHFGAGTKGAGPIAHWRLDTCHGSTAYDQAGSNNATLTPGATGSNTTTEQMWAPSGKFGSCIEFDGDDRVEIPSIMNGLSTMTVTAWFKYTNSSTWRWIFGSGSGSCVTGAAVKSGSNVIRYHVNTSNTTYTSGDGSTALSTGTWYHLAYVYDGSYVRGYINGVQDFSYPATGTITATGTRAIGAGYWTNNEYFLGTIDEVKVYNRNLSIDEVNAEYNAGFSAHLGAGIDPNEGNPPVAWLEFNEGTGNTAYDRSGSACNGTLTNMESEDWVMGKYGSGLQLDGNNEYVALGTPSTLTGLTAMTLEAWVYGAPWEIISWGNSTNDSNSDSYLFGVRTQSNSYYLQLFGRKASDGFHIKSGEIPDPSLSWHHMAVTHTGASGGDVTNYVKFYFDGRLIEGTTTVSGTQNYRVTDCTYTNVDIFSFISSAGRNYRSGKLDDVKVYNYARTPAQIAWDYNEGAPVAHWRLNEGEGYIAYEDNCRAEQGDAPLALWRMDEASSGSANGATIYDISGNQYNGAATSTTFSYASGKIGGGCLSFDGNDYVDCGDIDAAEGISAITVSAWFNSTASANYRTIVSKDYGTEGAWEIRMSRDSEGPNIGFRVNTANGSVVSGVSVITNGVWHNVVGVYDGAKTYIYMDGVLKDSDNQTGTINTTSTHVLIGQNGNNGEYFVGTIDNVAIYSYARTAMQIYEDYKNTHGYLVNMAPSSDWVTGKYGFTLDFDGTDDYVDCGDSLDGRLDFGATTDFTIEAWVKTSTISKLILGKGDGGSTSGKGFYFYTTSSGTFETGINDGVDPRVYVSTGGVSITDNMWHHVASVFDRDGNLQQYIDGKAGSSMSISGEGDISNTYKFKIGIGIEGDSRYFPGQIDDVRIYNYARSSAQILQDYNEGAAAKLGD